MREWFAVDLQAQDGGRQGLRHEVVLVLGLGPGCQQVLEPQQAPMAHIPLLLLDELVQQGQQGLHLSHRQWLHSGPHRLGGCLPHRSHNLSAIRTPQCWGWQNLGVVTLLVGFCKQQQQQLKS